MERGEGRPEGEQINRPQEVNRDKALADQVENSLKKWDRRQTRRHNRPVMLYFTRHQYQNLEIWRRDFDKMFKGFDLDAALQRLEDELDSEPQPIFQGQFFQTEDIAQSNLTPEEQQELEHQELLDNINRLKDERTMSGRINIAKDDIGADDLTRMQQMEPKFMTPIITGIQKHPARKAKAERAIQRIRQSRGETGSPFGHDPLGHDIK
jgi:hypothetical protein